MDKGTNFGQLTKKQYRSHKGHKAINQARNKLLAVNIIALQRSSLVLCSQGVMSCFDRISHAALAIRLKRKNPPYTAIDLLINTIKTIVHKFCTVFG